ncbi:MAG: thioredoxin [Bacteroidetes bacterium]|nr:thioredoxin [Bacteroidota bacterium]
MKKLTFVLLFLVALTFNACSNNDNKGKNNTSNTEGQVNKLTAESFQKLVWDYKTNPKEWVFNGDQPCIIDFYADWCRPCKMVAPIMDELSKEYQGKVRIYKVNTDEQRELAGLFNVNSIPAVLFVPKNGKPQMSVGAMQKPAYVEMITNVLMVK